MLFPIVTQPDQTRGMSEVRGRRNARPLSAERLQPNTAAVITKGLTILPVRFVAAEQRSDGGREQVSSLLPPFLFFVGALAAFVVPEAI